MSKDGESFESTTRAVRDMNAASAQTSQQHLMQLRANAANDAPDSTPEIVVVSIPDVSVIRSAGTKSTTQRETEPPRTPSEKWKVSADLSSEPESKKTADKRTPSTGSAAPSDSTSPSGTGIKSASSSISAAETPDKTGTPASTGTDAWWHSIADLSHDRPVEELSRKILRQFPSIAPASLLVASADAELSTNRSTARIATCIAKLTGCRVLLVDANWEANQGSIQGGTSAVRGLSEVITEGCNWKDLIVETQESQLFVLPCGIADVPMRRVGNDTVIALNAQWQREFTYVFVNAGHVRQWVARRFAVSCDGTYILVGLNQTTKTDAQTAMRLLSENHARVLGAIVFDDPPQG